ncbi:MAG: 2-oxoacid:acceptor oxidoreductase subunit alpha [Spirochaetota bacterium]
MNNTKKTEVLQSATIRFTGDSGDGMQLTGSQFTNTSALVGNDLATFPDFPAEIRAPAGTVPGVSGFQLNFASTDIHTPGDEPDVLVAMNPAALKANIADLKQNGILIVNIDSFTDKDLKKAGYSESPLTEDLKQKYQVFEVQLNKLTNLALEGSELTNKEIDRTKNMFALGMTYWMFSRPLEPTKQWIAAKFKGKDKIISANHKVLQAGFNYADTAEVFISRYDVPKASIKPGIYRNITGNLATALGLLTASQKADLKLFLGSYPITPASDILHELSKYKHMNVLTFQAEDEIAAISAAIGSSFGGGLAITSTSGPGLALKSEALNLAIITELPLVVIDVQRGGPSTGLPTKTEQSDLLFAMFGRNGESPVPIISASTPGDSFMVAIEAVRIALRFMTPVIMLSDGYLANGSEPWKVPSLESIPDISHNQIISHQEGQNKFVPYLRREETLARDWAIPGAPGLEHRIGGLEKDFATGNVSYNPENHEKMVEVRAEKVARIAHFIPEQEVYGAEEGELLVLGWGSTFGAIRSAVEKQQAKGVEIAHAHIRHINPFPRNLEELLSKYKKVLLPELNKGQLAFLIQGKFGIKIHSLHKVQGKPFTIREIDAKIEELLA